MKVDGGSPKIYWILIQSPYVTTVTITKQSWNVQTALNTSVVPVGMLFILVGNGKTIHLDHCSIFMADALTTKMKSSRQFGHQK